MTRGKARSNRPGWIWIVVLVAGATLAVPAPGQEGHPLVGSWHGAWGAAGSPDHRDLTVIMDWDGKQVTGMVNPVTDRAPLRNARLDSSNWSVHFEADLADGSGETMRCVADGMIDKLGSDERTLAGSWNCGDMEARFELTRDRDY